jgi:protein-S-isoprenylcysteine O-methyltransferase Ste14
VAVQFACIAFFIIYCGPLAKSLFTLLVQGAAVLLAIFSLLAMGTRSFSIFPSPKQGAPLVIKGPYRFIRHPLYTSVLLFCLALLVHCISLLTAGIFLLLLLNLLYKLHYEETLLLQQFPAYYNYRKTTQKLIPFIY